MRSASAALTAALACRDPRTVSEAMVARASSGVTSVAMVARPKRECRASARFPRRFEVGGKMPAESTLFRVPVCDHSAGRSTCLRIASDEIGTVRIEPFRTRRSSARSTKPD